jgi:hypothetical protein
LAKNGECQNSVDSLAKDYDLSEQCRRLGQKW